MSEPTPGPWTAERQDADDGHIYWAIHSSVGYEFITNVPDETAHSKANARLIVRAVNCHADLVAALEACLGVIEGTFPSAGPSIKAIRDNVRAALAKAGETE